MHNYENLEVWKKGMDLVQEVYQITKQFPDIERFGITSQITRAAVSIPSNIAEGAGRNSNKDFVHFLSIALGSAYELDTQMTLCKRIGYIYEEQYNTINNLIHDLQRMLINLQAKINPSDNETIRQRSDLTAQRSDSETV